MGLVNIESIQEVFQLRNIWEGIREMNYGVLWDYYFFKKKRRNFLEIDENIKSR